MHQLSSHKRLSHRTVLSVGTIFALFLSSCGESKVSQCNRLAEVVNQTQTFMQEFETEIQNFSTSAASVQNLEDITTAASQYTEAVGTVVTQLDSLATDLEGTELADESLNQFRDQYIEVVKGFNTSLQAAKTAMESVKDAQSEAELPALLQQSQTDTLEAVESIEQLSTQESEVIDGVNTYCGATPPTE